MRHAELKYLSEMLPQLSRMASKLDETLLAKLLEMAALEAELKFTLEAEYAAGYEENHCLIKPDQTNKFTLPS